MSFGARNDVTWDGAFNLRDLGGLPVAGGGTTAHGRIFRSGAPEFLTTAGWTAALAAGLTTIVDLRNAPRETQREPHHPEIDETVRAGIDILNRPTEDPDDEEFMRVCGPWLDHPRSYADNLAFYPRKFAAAFTAIADSPGAVLVHCSAGRDRTGMITAMLLQLTGVTLDTILDDYEAAVRGVNAFMAKHPEGSREPLRPEEELDARVVERRAALGAWLAGFDAAEYLAGAGLSGDTVARLRTRLIG